MTKYRCVVRVRTSAWSDKNGVHVKRELRTMRHHSNCDFLQEEAGNIGALEAIQSIVNLHQCDDGLYEVIAFNLRRDWETGYLEDYDLKLVPFTQPPPAA